MNDSARPIEIEGRGTVSALLFLEDGKHLLSGGEDGMIRQWSIEHGTQVGEPIKGNEPVRALSLSGDRKWIISGENKLARVWARHSWKEELRVQEHTAGVEAVDISPDSTKFATGATDKRAFIWDISTGRRLLGPLGHDGNVVAVKFSPSGNYIATASWDRDALRIYNVRTGQLIRTIPVKARGFSSIAWSKDSQRIFASSLNIVKHIYVDTGTLISQWTIPGDANGPHGSLAISSNDRFIASFVGNSLSLMDTQTGLRFAQVFEHPGQKLRSVAISVDNNYVATSGEGGIITLRNLSGIIPMLYLVQQSRYANGGHSRLQSEALEAFRATLRSLESRFDELRPPMRLNDGREPQAESFHILDGPYRIKSFIADVYLTCPQDPEGSVIVQQLDSSNDFQKWCVYHIEDGAYSIVGRRGSSDVALSSGSGNEPICIPKGNSTTWNIDPRGNTFVIGNSASVMAIHLIQHPQHVWAFPRDNSQNQRWVFERV